MSVVLKVRLSPFASAETLTPVLLMCKGPAATICSDPNWMSPAFSSWSLERSSNSVERRGAAICKQGWQRGEGDSSQGVGEVRERGVGEVCGRWERGVGEVGERCGEVGEGGVGGVEVGEGAIKEREREAKNTYQRTQ